MFVEEEEWNDDPGAEALTRAVIRGAERLDSTDVTPKGAGKKSLLRTLQTLGPVPTWTNGSVQEGGDSESEEVPSPTKRKKKRSKKRKRAQAAGNEGEEEGKREGEGEDPGAVVPKKKRQKEAKSTKMGKPERVNVKQKKDSNPEKKGEGGDKLTRQQWRNKMKMKKKSKNKFRPRDETTADTAKAGQKLLEPGSKSGAAAPDPNRAEKAVQAQSLKGEKKAPERDLGEARRRVKLEEVREENCNSLTDALPGTNQKKRKNKKAKLGGEPVGMAESCSKATEPEESASQIETGEKGPGNLQRKPQQTKEQRMLAEKLRRMLHRDGSSSRKQPIAKEEEEEEEEEEDSAGEAMVEESVPDRSAALRSKMEQRLESARFRYINEQLYTSTSREARRLFREDPQASGIYHRGYTAQVQRWPANPVDAVISYIKHKPASLVVADFGCGDCKIARSVKNKVHSFDLAPVCDLVTVCDMANVPLRNASVDIAVFCLSLMGTNLGDFLTEANRVLVMGGVLKIAEVASRFENVRGFMGSLSGLGFKLVSKDTENSHFFSFEFVKTGAAPEGYRKAGLELRPCVYKKR